MITIRTIKVLSAHQHSAYEQLFTFYVNKICHHSNIDGVDGWQVDLICWLTVNHAYWCFQFVRRKYKNHVAFQISAQWMNKHLIIPIQ